MIIKMGVDLKLEEFSHWLVEKPERVKVPYKTWRILILWQKNKAEVKVTVSQNTLIMRNMSTKDKLDWCTFDFTEEGFGKWVYDKLYNTESSKNITKIMGVDITLLEYSYFNKEHFGKGLQYLHKLELDTFKKWENDNRKVILYLKDNSISIRLLCPLKTEGINIIFYFDKDKTYYGAYLYNKFYKELEEKGEDNMKILNNSKFNFGTCENDNIRMSLYGLAVKNAEGTWVSYDPKNDAVMDADILNFDGGKFLFKMPVALKDIKEGDIIIHNRVPMFVKTVSEDNRIVAIDPYAGEEKIVMLTKSPFNFDFATKVISLFSMGDNVAAPDAPFGNMLPFLLMSDGKEDIDPVAMCMMMQQTGDFASNPMMMMYFLTKNKGDMNDILPFMFMMNANK